MTVLDTSRRGFLRAALFVAAAPVIVKASSLMPIRALPYEHDLLAVGYRITREAIMDNLYNHGLLKSFMETKEVCAGMVLMKSPVWRPLDFSNAA